MPRPAGTAVSSAVVRGKLVFVSLAVTVVAALVACSDSAKQENTGQSCDDEGDCYPMVTDRTTLKGQVMCLTRVTGGYCTHLCQTDQDCCAAQGECRTGHPQVCAPFESTGMKFCFLSCEAADVPDGGVGDTAYCQEFAHASFICRSTGGGATNRKVCVP